MNDVEGAISENTVLEIDLPPVEPRATPRRRFDDLRILDRPQNRDGIGQLLLELPELVPGKSTTLTFPLALQPDERLTLELHKEFIQHMIRSSIESLSIQPVEGTATKWNVLIKHQNQDTASELGQYSLSMSRNESGTNEDANLKFIWTSPELQKDPTFLPLAETLRWCPLVVRVVADNYEADSVILLQRRPIRLEPKRLVKDDLKPEATITLSAIPETQILVNSNAFLYLRLSSEPTSNRRNVRLRYQATLEGTPSAIDLSEGADDTTVLEDHARWYVHYGNRTDEHMGSRDSSSLVIVKAISDVPPNVIFAEIAIRGLWSPIDASFAECRAELSFKWHTTFLAAESLLGMLKTITETESSADLELLIMTIDEMAPDSESRFRSKFVKSLVEKNSHDLRRQLGEIQMQTQSKLKFLNDEIMSLEMLKKDSSVPSARRNFGQRLLNAVLTPQLGAHAPTRVDDEFKVGQRLQGKCIGCELQIRTYCELPPEKEGGMRPVIVTFAEMVQPSEGAKP